MMPMLSVDSWDMSEVSVSFNMVIKINELVFSAVY